MDVKHGNHNYDSSDSVDDARCMYRGKNDDGVKLPRLSSWNSMLPDTFSPPSLYHLCLNTCYNCVQERLLLYRTSTDDYDHHNLASTLNLPSNVMGDLIDLICTHINVNKTLATAQPNEQQIMKLLCSDPRFVRRKSVSAAGPWLTDADLSVILGFSGLEKLSLSFCDNVSVKSLLLLQKRLAQLQSLYLEGMTDLLTPLDCWELMETDSDGVVLAKLSKSVSSEAEEEGLQHSPQQPVDEHSSSNLRHLTIKYLEHPDGAEIVKNFLRPPHRLTYLNLSNSDDLGTLDYLTDLRGCLRSLVLHDVPLWENGNVTEVFTSLCQLKELRHLDIGWSGIGDLMIAFYKDDELLLRLTSSLPRLTALDISGTDLAGTITMAAQQQQGEGFVGSDIYGLSRLTRPLDFLGLLNTAHDACNRARIPAVRVAGDASEEQTLIAGQVYLHKPDLLVRALNDLFSLFRYSTVTNKQLAKEIILSAMALHVSDKHIQISGSASLFYIVKTEYDDMEGPGPPLGDGGVSSMSHKLKRDIISAILTAMANYTRDTTMLRNGCLTLWHFKLHDIMHDYLRLSEILIATLQEPEQEIFIQRISIYLLNQLACQVDGEQKCAVGDLGIITVMLSIVSDRINKKECDQIMEIAWSTMWNVTDETAVNCKRFLDGNGMDLFVQCLQTFPEKHELLRNMLGLMGNVAEVKELRPHLMTDSYINTFSELLQSTSDGIEISYNACGVLAHIMSDGADAWRHIHNPNPDDNLKPNPDTNRNPNPDDNPNPDTNHNPNPDRSMGDKAERSSSSRDRVLCMMVQAINTWDIHSDRNINYRSFEPIMRLVRHYETPECQMWACWAMANLTTVYPEKYCKLVRDENGEQLLSELTCHPQPDTNRNRVRELANVVLHNLSSDHTAAH